MFEVRLILDTGVPDENVGWDEIESPNGHYETRSFDTEAEARAFIDGVDIANEALSGWTDGYLEALNVTTRIDQLLAERAPLLEQLDEQGGRDFHIANTVDEINAELEQLGYED